MAEVICADDVGLHASKDTYPRGVLEGGGREMGSIAIVLGDRSDYVQERIYDG